MERVAQNRDKEAFTTLFDHFAPRIESHLQRLGLDAAQAEEIAQDVMITLWRKASLFDPSKSALSTWLYRIARNRRIDLTRRDRTDYVDPQSPAILEIASEGRSTRPSMASSAMTSCAGLSPNSRTSSRAS